MAAKRAAEIFAHEEAHALSVRGLKNLETAPASSEQKALELELQPHRGFAASILKGYSDQEVEEAMAKARALSGELGDIPQLATALFGLFTYI